MRNGQNNNKRMRGRNRKSGGHHQNPLSRVYESNGQDVKIRGTASHIAEKYLQLARDAQSSGDTIATENYYQHAEHYFRLIAAAQEQLRQSQPYFQQQPGDTRGNAAADDGYDDGDGEGWRSAAYGRRTVRAPRAAAVLSPRTAASSAAAIPAAAIQPQHHQPQHINRSINSRSPISRGSSTFSRSHTTGTSSGCRHSSPAASRKISRNRPAKARMRSERWQWSKWRPKRWQWTEWL